MANFHDVLKQFQNWFHSLVKDLAPALDYAEKNGGSAALQLAETFLAGAITGTPWATLIAQFIPAAEASGIVLAEQTASVILNLAKANLDAKKAV